MIAHPKVILCYGDSNTHGQVPATYSRYPITERWTGILQETLGDEYYIIEEGLGGRTVDIDERGRPGRNGFEYFLPCLGSHQPLDQVIIMLSTNDLKVKFNRSVEDIVKGVEKYLEVVKEYDANVLLISPIVLNPQAPQWAFYGEGCFDEMSAHKSKQLVSLLSHLASEKGSDFIAASSIVKPGIDGIHMDKTAHQLFAEVLAAKL